MPDDNRLDWEVYNLVAEVRRRVRAANATKLAAHLEQEPAWVAALPKAEAQFARSLLKATRQMVAPARPRSRSRRTL